MSKELFVAKIWLRKSKKRVEKWPVMAHLNKGFVHLEHYGFRQVRLGERTPARFPCQQRLDERQSAIRGLVFLAKRRE